jgi:hypothetical protein
VSQDHDIERLADLFRQLGVSEPRQAAQSQLEEGIPQLARYAFLKAAWERVISEDDFDWIDKAIQDARDNPSDPYAGIGLALARLRKVGAPDQDIAEVVRGMQASLLFSLLYLLDDPGDEAERLGVPWALSQINEDDEVVAFISGLHESVLETDPTGREMRPRDADQS